MEFSITERHLPKNKARLFIESTVRIAQCHTEDTGRFFDAWEKEHTWNVKLHLTGLNVANHAWTHDHRINFDNGHIN